MSIYLGNNKIKDLYLGSQKIGSIYLGSQKVYSSSQGIPSVTIGTQTWMSKNLAIDDGQGGIYTQTVQYDDYSEEEVVEYYYTWAAAVRVAATVQGWHLPSTTEWDTLASTVGSSTAGTKLKSTYGWTSGNGTDNYGFAVFPAGYRNSSGTFSLLHTGARFWTANSYSSSNAYSRYFTKNATMSSSNFAKTLCYSVRLVKDS